MTARLEKCDVGSTNKKKKTSTNRIVMNFTTPPSSDDLEALSEDWDVMSAECAEVALLLPRAFGA